LAIVGKSGSGKTTLLKCIFGLEDILSGEVLLGNKQVLGPSYNLIPGHEDMKLVSQDFYVLDNHTIEENIFDKLIGYTQEAKQKRADKILRLLELTKLKNTKARNLSSGQKQRVAIARALALIPKVMLLDEPFSNLDKLLTEKLYSFIISEVKKNKTSVILITHLAEEALKYADTLAVMDEGKIVQMGEKWQVYYQPKNTRLAGLLGDFNRIKLNDVEESFKFKNKNTLFLRPDKLKLMKGTAKGDIQLKITGCTFNGKCYELLCETLSGSSMIVYSDAAMETGKSNYFNLSD
jgi:ABC-type Fe3+/spermidine/putrescine transport system ATPase subunit